MNEIIIVDDMKKDAKKIMIPVIFVIVSGILLPLIWFWYGEADIDFIKKSSVFFIGCAIYGLYVLLSCVKYKLIVTNDKIVMNTLFKKWEIDFKNIGSYTYKQHRKSEIYKFFIRINKKIVQINTRHPNKLIELLDAHDISMVASKK
ncbi:MAG: hypothetical protein IJP20_01090 [Clostridia bacterium]|nr:hypothetical protein [Clostridia bacterium]